MKQTQPIEKPFITLKDITIRIRDRFILSHTCWEIKTHQHWVILGPNGAGKSVLVRALAGELPLRCFSGAIALMIDKIFQFCQNHIGKSRNLWGIR